MQNPLSFTTFVLGLTANLGGIKLIFTQVHRSLALESRKLMKNNQTFAKKRKKGFGFCEARQAWVVLRSVCSGRSYQILQKGNAWYFILERSERCKHPDFWGNVTVNCAVQQERQVSFFGFLCLLNNVREYPVFFLRNVILKIQNELLYSAICSCYIVLQTLLLHMHMSSTIGPSPMNKW